MNKTKTFTQFTQTPTKHKYSSIRQAMYTKGNHLKPTFLTLISNVFTKF